MIDIAFILAVIIKCIVSSVLVFFVGAAAYIYREHSRLDHIPGPKRSNFFLGNVLQIRKKRNEEGKIIHRVLADWSSQYRPFFLVWFFHVPLTVVTDADVVRDILVVKNLPKDSFGYYRFQYVFGERFLGHGVLTDLNNATWEAKRRVVNPILNRNKLIAHDYGTMAKCCENFLERLHQVADGKTEISLTDEFFLVTLETLLKIAFSITMDNPDIKTFQKNFKNALNGITLSFRDPTLRYQLWSSEMKDCAAGARYSRNVLKSVIENRRKEMASGTPTKDDVLNEVLKAEQTIPNCGFEDLVDMLVTLVFGGMETMGNHVGFTLFMICLHPDVEKKLRKELEGADEEMLISGKGMESMRYLDCVIKESLRMHPPTPAITRQTTEDTNIGGILIPHSTPIMVNAFVLHHHPRYWQNPEEFDPDRFGDDTEYHPNAYIPFSLGPRRCAGVQFANLQEKLLIARVLKKFSIELAPGQTIEMALNRGFSTHSGVRCTMKPLAN